MKDFLVNLWQSVQNFFVTRWNSILMFVLVLILGIIVVRSLTSVFGRSMRKSKLRGAAGDFLTSLVKVLLYIIYIIALLSMLGVPTTSMVAVLSAFALAVSLALQGAFSNVAAGIVLVTTRPFLEGDYIDVAGVAGTVETITIFNTKLVTPDNKAIVLPNSAVTGANITNFSAKETRRLDISLSVAYGTDAETVKETVNEVVSRHSEILQVPQPMVRLAEQGESALIFTVRVWVLQKDYWPMNFDLKEEFYRAFREKNITIPFPQMDVHIIEKK